jgi:hypothetical protein
MPFLFSGPNLTCMVSITNKINLYHTKCCTWEPRHMGLENDPLRLNEIEMSG